jgi:hypothetical protein
MKLIKYLQACVKKIAGLLFQQHLAASGPTIRLRLVGCWIDFNSAQVARKDNLHVLQDSEHDLGRRIYSLESIDGFNFYLFQGGNPCLLTRFQLNL